MKTLLRLAGMLAALAALASLAHGQSTRELANRLFERTGLAVQLESLPAQFEQGLSQNRGKVPDQVLAALAEAAKRSYAVSALRAEIVPMLARKMPAGDMRQVLAWLDGPLGRRVTLAEESAAASMTPEAMQVYFESERSKPASQKRARLITDLIAVTNAVEISTSFIEATTLGIAVGMDATQPVEKRIGVANLRARLRAALPPDKLRANMSASLPAMYGFTYREIGDADLAAYVKFNGSPLGRRYNKAVTESLGEALTRASVRVGEFVQAASEKKQI